MEEELERDMSPKLIGETYMRKATEKSANRTRYGLYECPFCEKEFETLEYSVRSGATKSCGCMLNKKNTSHGFTFNRFYSTWYTMLYRCNNPKSKVYNYYGGRGITVCEEWLDVTNFVAWCDLTHPNIEGLSLDRIDVDGNYEPNNCRWADASTQALNQRVRKDNKSGVVGVSYKIRDGVWVASICVNNTRKHIGSFPTKEEAVQARDNYIIENKLPHKLSTGYKREDS